MAKIQNTEGESSKGMWLLFLIAVGGLAAYFFSPTYGRRRRAMVKDKAIGLKQEVERFVGERADELTAKAKDVYKKTADAVEDVRH